MPLTRRIIFKGRTQQVQIWVKRKIRPWPRGSEPWQHKPEGSRRELVENNRRAFAVVSVVAVVVKRRQGQAELVHRLRAEDSGQELVESDVLVDRDHDLPRLLEHLLFVPVRVQQLQLLGQPVVL